LRRLGRYSHVLLTTAAGVLHPLVNQHFVLWWNVFELFAPLAANLAADKATLRAASLIFREFVENRLSL
jgi:hypothetical protein